MPAAWPLVGRNRELELFGDLLAAGERSAVILAGPAGVGKSRLGAECLAVAEARGLATARVTGSEAGRDLPFVALAPLLPRPTGSAPEPGDMLVLVVEAVAQAGLGRRLVLLVDDAHLLDDASATVIHQLVATRVAFVVATLRSGEPAPDPIVALWKDELAERIDVSPLTEANVEALLTTALGGPVSLATLHQLAEHSAGNTLYLRELVRAATESRALTDEDGIWRLSGSVVVSPRLVELIEARLTGVVDPPRMVLEALAFGQPLGVPCLLHVVDAHQLEALEHRGLIVTAYDGRRMEATLAHPLYGEVIRTRIPALRGQAVLRRLADRVETAGARRRDDALRFATWRLNAGGTMTPELMVSAAKTARSRWDLALAGRLADAAVQAGGGFDAALVRAEVALLHGSGDEAENQLAALQPLAGDDAELVRVVSLRVDNLVRAIGDTAGALAVVEDADAAVTDPTARHQLAAKRAFALHMGGRLSDALEALEPLLTRVDAPAYRFACYTAAACLVRAGRFAQALAMVEASDRAVSAPTWPAPEPSVQASLAAVRCAALIGSGALEEAERLAAAEHAQAASGGSSTTQAVSSLVLTRVHLAAGRVAAAARYASEARQLFRERRFRNPARTALTYLAQAQALAGAVEGARSALAAVTQLGLPTEALNAVELHRARAWTEVAAGNLAGARAHLLDSATLARRQGDVVWESDALHDLARLGWPAEAEPRLRALAAVIEGRLAPARARHVTALVAQDAAALSEVATEFHAMGAVLLAAEAAAAAAVALRRQGEPRRAASSELRAAELARRCEGAITPALRDIETQAVLSAREIEVAALAAAGLANREIAARLSVSVRTVENHLQRVYEKLGVARRADLSLALASV